MDTKKRKFGNRYTGGKKEKYTYTLFWNDGTVELLENIDYINKYFKNLEDRSKMLDLAFYIKGDRRNDFYYDKRSKIWMRKN